MRFLSVIWNMLRELSDESAYARHLHFSGRAHSADEWRHFTDCRYRRKYHNAKCC